MAVFGTTVIITLSSIMAPIRNFFATRKLKNKRLLKLSREIGILLNCPLCTSFWVGGIIGLLWRSPTDNFFIDAVAGSGATWLLYTVAWNLALRHQAG